MNIGLHPSGGGVSSFSAMVAESRASSLEPQDRAACLAENRHQLFGDSLCDDICRHIAYSPVVFNTQSGLSPREAPFRAIDLGEVALRPHPT